MTCSSKPAVRRPDEAEVWCIHNGALWEGGLCFSSKEGVHQECLDAHLASTPKGNDHA